MSGTKWVEPGKGSTVRQFQDALIHWMPPDWIDVRSAMRKRFKLGDAMNHATDLALTGEPLTAEDLENIARAK